MVEFRQVGFDDDEGLKYLTKVSMDIKDTEEALGYIGYPDDEIFLTNSSKFIIAATIDPTTYYTIVATIDDEIVGGLVGEITYPGGVSMDNEVGMIKLIGVEPEYRDQDIGKTLVAMFEDWCWDRGITLMEAALYAGNEIPQEGLAALGWGIEFVLMTKRIKR